MPIEDCRITEKYAVTVTSEPGTDKSPIRTCVEIAFDADEDGVRFFVEQIQMLVAIASKAKFELAIESKIFNPDAYPMIEENERWSKILYRLPGYPKTKKKAVN